MELLKKDQIRLSNGIWRSWHIQFQKGRVPLFCKFVVDPEVDVESHRYPQGVVIEGKYWKRTREAVANEYRKWRLFYKRQNEWSEIRRLPHTAGPHTSMMDSRTNDITGMLVDDNSRFGNFLFAMDGIQDFSDIMFDFPRQGDERSYMRPLIESTEMLQPNLETLNPTLEEFLSRLEPMEVMFPSSLTNVVAPPPTDPPTYIQQNHPIPAEHHYNGQYLPDKQVGEYPPGYHGNSTFSPTPFLAIPQESRMKAEGDSMDLGTPPSMATPIRSNVPSYNAPPTTIYQQSSHPTPSYIPLAASQLILESDKSMMTPYIDEIQTTPIGSTPVTPTPNYGFNSDMQQQMFMGGGYGTTPIQSSNHGSRRSSGQEPLIESVSNVHFIAEQMKRLEKQQLEQLREIEKQQSLATEQYLELLNQYIANSSGREGHPSQEQQRELASVLSNPSSVEILKSILLQDKSPKNMVTVPVAPPIATPTISIKQETMSPQQSSNNLKQMEEQQQQKITPQVNIDSDFKSRLVMAAAAQTNNNPSLSYNPFSICRPQSSINSPNDPSAIEPTEAISPSLLNKFKNARNLTPEEKRVYQEMRRRSHITAEQKRRGNIKNGFEQLHSLVINPSQFPSGKVSKAVLLDKTIEYLNLKHSEREAKEKRIEELKAEVQELNQSISKCQQSLPASGISINRQKFEENKQMFKDYVQMRTQENYKFWIVSITIINYVYYTLTPPTSIASC
jgi:MAX-like protein X